MHEGVPQYEPSMCLFSLVDSWVSVEGLGIGKVVKFEGFKGESPRKQLDAYH